MTAEEAIRRGTDVPAINTAVAEVSEIARRVGSYAYRFVDVGDRDRLVEVRCFPDHNRFQMTEVDRRGLPVGHPVTPGEPYVREVPVKVRRRWFRR